MDADVKQKYQDNNKNIQGIGQGLKKTLVSLQEEVNDTPSKNSNNGENKADENESFIEN